MTSQPKGYGPEWDRQLQESGWWHSFELPGGESIQGVNTLESLKNRIAQFPIPENLRGKRVLDVGAWDGWFSFEMERRGAEVVAIDCWDNPRFREIHSAYRSRVDYRVMDVMDVSRETVGRFDIVLFFGVLYHLKHPLMALEKICAITTDFAAVDSYILRDNFDAHATPLLEFYETDEMEGRADNWCAPNLACLMAMCRTAGFARVHLQSILPYSACVACYRKWQPTNPSGPRAELLSAAHRVNYGINFDSRGDDYLTCGFRTGQGELTLDDVQLSVGPYGVRPIALKNLGTDLWQTAFKLPPGLDPGWHGVSLAVRGGPADSARQIAVDIPIPECELKIEGVRDGLTWAPDTLDLKSGRALALWCAGLPENADRNNVRVLLNGVRCTNEFIAPPSPSRQINVRVPEKTSTGPAEVVVTIGKSTSGPTRIVVSA